MTDDIRTLTDETQRLWNQKAAFWSEQMGPDGNQFHRMLVGPSAERLLAIQPGEVVADIACGSGTFARRLAQLGARVTATDFSAQFLEAAKKFPVEASHPISYRLVDATNEGQVRELGQHRFDAVVCNMALMDMTTIEPLLGAMSHILKPEGRFVFTVPHPCFNSSGIALSGEVRDRQGTMVYEYAIKVYDYLHIPPQKGTGMVGEPTPHYYFDRPIHVLLSACFKAGLVMDGVEEPAFPEGTASSSALGIGNFPHIPLVFAARLRVRQR